MFDGRLGIALEQPRLKGGLQQTALPQPLVIFADKHVVPRKAPNGAAVSLELREERTVRDQDIADQVGMIHQACAIRPEAELRQVAVIAHEAGQEFKWIPSEAAP